MAVKVIKVKTTIKETGEKRGASFSYDIPSSLQEAVDKYGEALAFEEFFSGLNVTLQQAVRPALMAAAEGLSQGEYDEIVQKEIDVWTLGSKRTRTARAITPTNIVASLAALWPSLDEARRAEVAARFGFVYAPQAPPEPAPEPVAEVADIPRGRNRG